MRSRPSWTPRTELSADISRATLPFISSQMMACGIMVSLYELLWKVEMADLVHSKLGGFAATHKSKIVGHPHHLNEANSRIEI